MSAEVGIPAFAGMTPGRKRESRYFLTIWTKLSQLGNLTLRLGGREQMGR
jgi:hypothetical protein